MTQMYNHTNIELDQQVGYLKALIKHKLQPNKVAIGAWKVYPTKTTTALLLHTGLEVAILQLGVIYKLSVHSEKVGPGVYKVWLEYHPERGKNET